MTNSKEFESYHRCGRTYQDNSQNPFPALGGLMLGTIAAIGAWLWCSAQLAKWLLPLFLIAVFAAPTCAQDFNGNGSVDVQDVEILQFACREYIAVVETSPDPESDVEDAVLAEYGYVVSYSELDRNQDGYLVWLVGQNPSTASDSDWMVYIDLGTYYGDPNLDGIVSFIDFVILANNYGQAGRWCDGDLDGDGQVSLIDLDILRENYGLGS